LLEVVGGLLRQRGNHSIILILSYGPQCVPVSRRPSSTHWGIRSPGHFTLPGLLRAAYRRGLGGTRR
jgi:hypothetical protein